MGGNRRSYIKRAKVKRGRLLASGQYQSRLFNRELNEFVRRVFKINRRAPMQAQVSMETASGREDMRIIIRPEDIHGSHRPGVYSLHGQLIHKDGRPVMPSEFGPSGA